MVLIHHGPSKRDHARGAGLLRTHDDPRYLVILHERSRAEITPVDPSTFVCRRDERLTTGRAGEARYRLLFLRKPRGENGVDGRLFPCAINRLLVSGPEPGERREPGKRAEFRHEERTLPLLLGIPGVVFRLGGVFG